MNTIPNSHGNDSIYTLYLTTNFDCEYYNNKCTAHTFYTPTVLGLSSMPLNEQQLIRLLKDNPTTKKSILKKWLKEFALKTTYEISIPALRDTSLAPKGKSAIIISTVFNYDLTSYLNDENLYQYFKETFNKYIIDIFEKYIFNNLKTNIIDNFSSTPLTIERLLNNSEGAITGWSFSNEIPVENRMKKMAKAIFTPFEDILQTGHWVFSPSGMPTSIIIGKLAADRIIKIAK